MWIDRLISTRPRANISEANFSQRGLRPARHGQHLQMT